MITLTEELYDGEVGRALVQELLLDLNDRYASDFCGLGQEEIDQGDSDYLAEVTAEMVTRPVGVFLVAWKDGTAVGCGALRPLGGEGVAEIKRMYTAPATRGQGVGRVVLDRLLEIATELGYRSMRLETGARQQEAVALYESDGWERIEPYGSHREASWSICFAKELGSS